MKQMCLPSGRPTAFVCERVSTTTNTTTTITTTYTLDQAGQNSFLCPRLAPELDALHPQGGRPMLAQGQGKIIYASMCLQGVHPNGFHLNFNPHICCRSGEHTTFVYCALQQRPPSGTSHLLVNCSFCILARDK